MQDEQRERGIVEPNLTNGPVSISFGAADQPMPPANRGLVDADLDGLATEIMNEARMSLMMAFRFLDTALWRMPYKMAACPMPLATNGKELFVAAVPTLVRFEQGMNEVVRDYLHTILHCVFRHPFDTDHLNIPAWSLACDIVVEAIALEMTERRFDCEYDDERRDELKLIEKKVGSLSPVKLYRVFASAEINAEP